MEERRSRPKKRRRLKSRWRHRLGSRPLVRRHFPATSRMLLGTEELTLTGLGWAIRTDRREEIEAVQEGALDAIRYETGGTLLVAAQEEAERRQKLRRARDDGTESWQEHRRRRAARKRKRPRMKYPKER